MGTYRQKTEMLHQNYPLILDGLRDEGEEDERRRMRKKRDDKKYYGK
jgi:hypothetical protein